MTPFPAYPAYRAKLNSTDDDLFFKPTGDGYEGYYSMDVLLHFIQFLKNKISNEPNFEDIRISLIDTLSNYSYIMSKSSANYLILTSAFLSCM